MLNPAGGLICPANDLLRYARFQLGDGRLADGGRLLSPASMTLMRTPRVADALHNGCPASFADEVGLSWFGRATGRGRLLVHGGMSSLALRLTLVPERRFAVFVLTNADLGAQLHAEITKQALRDGAGIDGLDATPLPAPPADPAPDAGTYRLAGPDDEDVAVRRGGDRLTLSEWGEAGFDAPGSDRRARGPLAARARQFLRGAEGRIGYLRIGGRLWRRVS